jgi:hypothetical protein
MQYLTNGRRKYIWEPGNERELFFNLEDDPDETVNLVGDHAAADEVALWRGRLIDRLDGRPEGFVRDGTLVSDCERRIVVPEYQELAPRW